MAHIETGPAHIDILELLPSVLSLSLVPFAKGNMV